MITWSTWSPDSRARSSAAAIANPPRSVAEQLVRAPSSFPIGVRAPETMTDPMALTIVSTLVEMVSPTASPDATSAAPAGDTALFDGIDHVGLAVPDLDAAIQLHTGLLGWRLVHRETSQDHQVDEAMLVTGDGSGAQLQLMAPLSGSSTIARFLDRRGPGLQQIAYRVGDLDAVTAELGRRGVRLLYPTSRRGTAGTMINFVHPHDTLGVLIELVQHLPAPAEPGGSSGVGTAAPGN